VCVCVCVCVCGASSFSRGCLKYQRSLPLFLHSSRSLYLRGLRIVILKGVFEVSELKSPQDILQLQVVVCACVFVCVRVCCVVRIYPCM
jgi:hypothetical protein